MGVISSLPSLHTGKSQLPCGPMSIDALMYMISCYRNAETWNPIMDDTWTTIITCVILIIKATEIITTIACSTTVSNKQLESQRNMENQRNILIAMITILKTTTTIMNTTIMIMSIARCKLKHLEHLHK